MTLIYEISQQTKRNEYLLKIDNWGDALDDILDVIVNLKQSKNAVIKETSVIIDEKVLDFI